VLNVKKGDLLANVYDVDPQKLIEAVAEEFKKDENIKPPEWAVFVKTGSHKEKVPARKDWWYVRCASILRKIYIQPRGISRLRVAYGGRKNRGYKPERFGMAGGNIIRKGLQQLEKSGYVKKGKKGREITPKGQKSLDNMAYKISKG
jgi:small subunit ribosomal protein S19e